MASYTIQCYVETLSNDKKITIHGCDGYRILKDEQKYLIFWGESTNNSEQTHNCILIRETEVFSVEFQTQNNNSLQLEDMLLAAHVNHKKIELTIEFDGPTTSFKINKMKLLQ